MDRTAAVIDAPSNLGLRPPAEGAVPGCYKLAGALRDCRFVTLFAPLVGSPRCVGVHVGIFDPDLDPDGRFAHELTDTLVTAIAPALT